MDTFHHVFLISATIHVNLNFYLVCGLYCRWWGWI